MASATFVNVTIHSNTSEFPTEKRYDVNIKIAELKKKLELITGANHATMKLSLTVDDKDLGFMSKDDETLAHYLGEHACKDANVKLNVEDEHPSLINVGGDTPKFVIAEEKYLQRPNNARNFIKEMREKRMSGVSNSSSSGQ